MEFYKRIENGYLTQINIDSGGTEITETEYNEILSVIRSIPTAPKGYSYRLTENLEWELYELPAVEDEELTGEEALEILLGGAV